MENQSLQLETVLMYIWARHVNIIYKNNLGKTSIQNPSYDYSVLRKLFSLIWFCSADTCMQKLLSVL